MQIIRVDIAASMRNDANMLDIRAEIDRMEAALKERGVAVRRLHAEAGIAASTWHRWKIGANAPNTALWGRYEVAFNNLIAMPLSNRSKRRPGLVDKKGAPEGSPSLG